MRTLVTLMRNWRLSPDALRALQERKLRRVVRHAYERVPYYRGLFQRSGLHPDDIHTLEDLPKIPVSYKQDLLASGAEELLTMGVRPEGCHITNTSGTTGQPMVVYTNAAESRLLRGLEVRGMHVIGRRWHDHTAVLGIAHTRPRPLHQRLGINRTSAILNHLPLEEQGRLLQTLQPDLLWAYPSILTAVLHRVQYRLGRLARPRLLITSSEMLDPWVRQQLEVDPGPELFNWYGCMEVGRIAFECPAHEGLHINADHVIVECLRERGPDGTGEPGTVVVTSLDSFTMPFLRYALGDTARILPQRCSCGSSFPLLDLVLGRNWDMIVLPDGTLYPPGVAGLALQGSDWIRHFRTVQERLDLLRVDLVVTRPASDGEWRCLHNRYRQLLGPEVEIEFRIVDEIVEPTTRLGTFVSRLPDWHQWAKAAVES